MCFVDVCVCVENATKNFTQKRTNVQRRNINNLPVVLVVLTISAKTISPCSTTSSELSDNIPNKTGNNPLACTDI